MWQTSTQGEATSSSCLSKAAGLMSCSCLCGQCPRNLGRWRALQLLADETSGFEYEVEVDAGVYSQAVEQIHYVFGGDIARCALGIGTAAEAGDGAVHGGYAELHRGIQIGQRLAVGV